MEETIAAKTLAQNLSLLRHSRGITQNQLAQLSGIPRSTITHLESGAGNPSLNNLVRIAQALEVQVQALLNPPRSATKLYRSDEIASKEKNGCFITDILPGGVKGCTVERFEMPAKQEFVGVPHQRGTQEYFSVIQGRIQVTVASQQYELAKGDVLVFPGEERHAYRNLLKTAAVGLSVLIA